MSESISTTDLYESTFYLMGGCELTGIEAQRIDGLDHLPPYLSRGEAG